MEERYQKMCIEMLQDILSCGEFDLEFLMEKVETAINIGAINRIYDLVYISSAASKKRLKFNVMLEVIMGNINFKIFSDILNYYVPSVKSQDKRRYLEIKAREHISGFSPYLNYLDSCYNNLLDDYQEITPVTYKKIAEGWLKAYDIKKERGQNVYEG